MKFRLLKNHEELVLVAKDRDWQKIKVKFSFCLFIQ